MERLDIIEEIALEGLEGITVEALWKRLEHRENSDYKLDEAIKAYVWKVVCKTSEVEFFVLPEPREELIIFKLNSYIKQKDYKHIIEETPQSDFYSYNAFEKDGLRGNCSVMEKRENVSTQVRDDVGTAILSLTEATERWGQRLVIVASQRQRTRALTGSVVFPTAITMEAYCVLERIGRSRYEGEIGKSRFGRGLFSETIAFKQSNLHLCVCKLLRAGYITKQRIVIKYHQYDTVSVCLYHLNKFCRTSGGSLQYLLHQMAKRLQESPNHQLELHSLLRSLGDVPFKKLRKDYNITKLISKYFVIENMTYREAHPEATRKEFLLKNGTEKVIFIIRLVNVPYDNSILLFGADDDDDEEDEDVDSDEEKAEAGNQNKKTVFNIFAPERTLTAQMKELIDRAGTKGLSFKAMMQLSSLDRFTVTALCRKLGSEIVQITQSIGTTQKACFISKKHASKLKRETVKKTVTKTPTKSQLKKPVEEISQEEEGSILDVNKSKNLADVTEKDSLEEMLARFELTLTELPSPNEKEDLVKSKWTDKKMFRRQMILDLLDTTGIYARTYDIRLEIIAKEEQLGMTEKLDRRSLHRILDHLYRVGCIKYMIVTSVTNSNNSTKLVCHKDLERSDERVKHAVRYVYSSNLSYSLKSEKGSMKVARSSLSSLSKPSPEKKRKEETEKQQPVSIYELLETSKAVKLKPDINKSPGTALYERCSKFERVKLLHEYLFYLLYEYRGEELVDQKDEIKVFLDVSDWRRYLPPLQKFNSRYFHGTDDQGVCMMGDIILYMPLIVFCIIVQISWPIEGLSELLKDKTLRNYPLIHVPTEIREQLVGRRKYTFKISEVWKLMSEMGLLSFPKKVHRLRELQFLSIYLHKHATLLDTRNGQKGYNKTQESEYPRTHFTFNCMNDIIYYWVFLKEVAFSSNLGHTVIADTDTNLGTVQLSEPLQRRVTEQEETDWLPGDNRGAAGLDSSLFVHFCKNWVNPQMSVTKKTYLKRDVKYNQSAAKYASKKPFKKKKFIPTKKKSKQKKDGKDVVRKRKRGAPLQRVKKKKKVVLDAVDKKAKNQLKKQRAVFVPVENGLLLICWIANDLILPDFNMMYFSFVDIRDLFRELLGPMSHDKTSYSLRGKFNRMHKDQNFCTHMAYYKALVSADKDLVAKYGGGKHQTPSLQLFRDCVKDLMQKFRSPRGGNSMDIPPSLEALHQKYTRQLTMPTPPLTSLKQADPFSLGDSMFTIVWEFLVSLMHHTETVNNLAVYNTLLQFEDQHITRVYQNLRKEGIISRRKLQEIYMEPKKTLTLMKNHVMSKSHVFSMCTRQPLKLFPVMWQILLFLHSDETQIESAPTTSSDKRVEEEMEIDESKEQSDDNRERTNDNKERTDNSFTKCSTEKISYNTDCVPSQSHSGKRLVDLVRERQRAGTRGEIFPSVSIRDNNFYSKSHHALPFSSLDINNIKGEALDFLNVDREDGFLNFDMNNAEGGAVLATLMVLLLELGDIEIDIPDNMVHFTEEGLKRLQFLDNKRKRDKQTKECEDNERLSEDEEGQSSSSSPEKKMRFSKGKSPIKKKQTEVSANTENVCVQFGNTKFIFRKQSIDPKLSGLTSSKASGSLFILARSSLFSLMDIDTTRVQLNNYIHISSLNISVRQPPVRERSSGQAPREAHSEKKKDIHKMYQSMKEMVLSQDEEVEEKPTQRQTHSLVKESLKYIFPEESRNTNSGEKAPCNSFPFFRHISQRNSSSLIYEAQTTNYQDLLWRMQRGFTNEDINNSSWETSVHLFIDSEYVDLLEEIYRVVDDYGETGVSAVELERKLKKPISQLQILLNKLCQSSVILKMGSLTLLYVSLRHARNWMVATTSDYFGHSEKTWYPWWLWRQLDGSLDLEVFQQLTHMVFTHLMHNPGTTVSSLAAHFSPRVQERTLREMIDIYSEIGCIRLCLVQNRSRCHGPFELVPVSHGPGWLSNSEWVVRLSLDATIRMAHFLHWITEFTTQST